MRVGEMAQQVEMFAAQPDNPELNHRIHMV